MIENITVWLAWKLPKRLAMWAFIRVATWATIAEYSGTEVPALTCVDALDRWVKGVEKAK